MTVGTRRLRLADRDKRALRLGLRLSAPALLYAFAVKPYVASVRTINGQLQTQSELLAREQSLVENAPSIPRLIATARLVGRSTSQRMYSDPDPIAVSTPRKSPSARTSIANSRSPSGLTFESRVSTR